MKELFKSVIVKVFLTFFFAATLISLTTEANGPHGVIDGGKWLIVVAISLMGFFYAYFIAEQDSVRTISGAHVKEWILRAIYISSLPVILYIQGSGNWTIGVAFCGGTSFFLMFNRFYNKRKKYVNLEYVGHQAFLDKTIRFLKLERFYFMIRLILWMAAHTLTIIAIL